MVDNTFKEAISSRNFTELRDMLRNRLFLDHDVTGGQFSEHWAECKKAGLAQNIFQAPDETEISSEKSEENYNKLVGQLSKNFSEARLNAILSLAKSLWPNEQTVSSAESSFASAEAKTTSSRVVGEERIIGERVLNEKERGADGEKSSERREGFRGSTQNQHQEKSAKTKEDSGIGVVVAVAAVAAVAIIAGVVIFG